MKSPPYYEYGVLNAFRIRVLLQEKALLSWFYYSGLNVNFVPIDNWENDMYVEKPTMNREY